MRARPVAAAAATAAAAAAAAVPRLDLRPRVDDDVAQDLLSLRATICSAVYRKMKANRVSILVAVDFPVSHRQYALLVQGKVPDVVMGERTAELTVSCL